MRAIARQVRSNVRRLRFHAWVTRAQMEVRLNGGRLKVEAPFGAALADWPTIRATNRGQGSGLFTLRFGRDVRIGRGLTLEVWAQGDNLLELGDRTEIMNDVRIALRSGGARFGRRCLIRDGVWLKTDGELRAGDLVTLSHHSAVHCTERIDLEDCVGLGERVSVIDSDHIFNGDEVHYTQKPVKTTPIRIGRNSMIAINAVVLRGARIGRNAVVAANAVVRGGDYPDASVIGGNPAQVVKRLGPPAK